MISQIGYVILLSDKPFHPRLSLCHHNEWLMLRKKICNITDAMLLQRKNETQYFVNTRTLHRISIFKYSESDIWKMLVEMNIQDEDLLDNCYDFLCCHPNAIKNLFGLPLERRMRKDNDYKSLNYVKIWLYFIMHMCFLFGYVILFMTQIPKQIKDFHDSFERYMFQCIIHMIFRNIIIIMIMNKLY